MRDFGYALMSAGAVMVLVIGGAGYLLGMPRERLFGGEPPQWLLLSPEERDAERRKAFAKIGSWKPRFQKISIAGALFLLVGAILAIAG